MKIDGQCHCGKLAYEAEVNPDKVYVCHCSDCQSITGSTYRWAVPVAEKDFKLLRGEPRTYVKVSDSGRESHQLFCPDCASPLYSTAVTDGPRSFNLRVGTSNQRDQLAPVLQVWHRSAQHWVDGLGSVRAIEKQ